MQLVSYRVEHTVPIWGNFMYLAIEGITCVLDDSDLVLAFFFQRFVPCRVSWRCRVKEGLLLAGLSSAQHNSTCSGMSRGGMSTHLALSEALLGALLLLSTTLLASIAEHEPFGSKLLAVHSSRHWRVHSSCASSVSIDGRRRWRWGGIGKWSG